MFQSSFKAFHSTKIELLNFFAYFNDILLPLDSGDPTALLLLDLRAAFDTVDHSTVGYLDLQTGWRIVERLFSKLVQGYLPDKSDLVSLKESVSSSVSSMLNSPRTDSKQLCLQNSGGHITNTPKLKSITVAIQYPFENYGNIRAKDLPTNVIHVFFKQILCMWHHWTRSKNKNKLQQMFHFSWFWTV